MHKINQFGEVVPFRNGRMSDDISEYREPTDYELELLEEIQLLREACDTCVKQRNMQFDRRREAEAEVERLIKLLRSFSICEKCGDDLYECCECLEVEGSE